MYIKIKAIIENTIFDNPLMQMITQKPKNIIRTDFNKSFELIANIIMMLVVICKIIIIAWEIS